MVNVSEQEEEALRLLDDGGDYGDVLSEYDNGDELIESLDEKNLLGSTENGVKADLSGRARRYLKNSENGDWENSFPGLNENEAWTLYGTLAGASRSDIAEFLDVSGPAVSNYRNTLVDQNYLRNLQPGRGPSDYIPGSETIERMDHYRPSPQLLEDVEPSRPLEEDKAVRWLIGEELYEKLHRESLEETKSDAVTVPEPNLNGHAEEHAVQFLQLVESGDNGFGVIADTVEEAHRMADSLKDQGLVEDSREASSGMKLTDTGEKYLENADIEVESIDKNRKSQKRRSSNTSRSKASTTPESNGADKNLQEIGAELLDDHVETIEQKGDQKRDFTDEEESEEVDIENDNAGYEGFT